MHALAPYSVKCFAQEKQGKREDKYYSLDKLPGGYDLLTLLSSFINARNNFVLDENSKQVFRFSDIELDNKNRVLSGWMH